MRTFKIISTHNKIKEAVDACDFDLSYNLPLALQRVSKDDSTIVEKAFVVEDESGQTKILYVYNYATLHNDLRMKDKYKRTFSNLAEFSPFVSCVSNSNMRIAIVNEEEIDILSITFPKNKEGWDCLEETLKHTQIEAYSTCV